jgi:hypothetical protein
MNTNPLRCLLTALLLAAAVLAPGLARADGAPEEFYQPRTDIRDDALRNVIGVATVGMGPEPRGELPVYQPDAEGEFELVGSLKLDETRAVSGWDGEVDSVRRFPVLEKRGEFLLAVTDVCSNERVWIREHEWRGPEDFVIYNELETAFVGSGVDVISISRAEEAALYRAPSPDAREGSTGMEPPLDALRVMRVQGDFAQVGLFRGLEEDPEPVGWVRIRDDHGLLMAWPVMTDDC